MPTPTETLIFTLRSSIFDRSRVLTLHPGYMEFDDNDLAGTSSTRFIKEDIEELRYGVELMRGRFFYIGRTYCIDVRNAEGKIIGLRLKSIYGIRRKRLQEKYTAIVNALYQYYFWDITRHYVSLHNNHLSFEMAGVNVSPEGVLFDNKIGRVSWDFLGSRRYWTYYTLFSEMDPNQYKIFEFNDHWNAGILYGAIETILKQKFPQRKAKPDANTK